ncbi:MAG: hypothetical protein U1E65_05170 [Myxococcota bacterium]
MKVRLLIFGVLLGLGCTEKLEWEQRSVPTLKLNLMSPCPFRQHATSKAKAGATIREFLAGCGPTAVMAAEAKYPHSEQPVDEEATRGLIMDMFVTRSGITGCERTAFRLGDHLGAEYTCSVSQEMAKRELAVDRGGTVVIRFITLGAEERSLIWYGVGLPDVAHRVVESARLE